jgi:hypothetical protein
MASSDFFILHFSPARDPRALSCSSLLGTMKGMTRVRSASGFIHFFFSGCFYIVCIAIIVILTSTDTFMKDNSRN